MNRNEKDFDIDKEFSRQMQEAAYVYSKEKYRMTPEDDAFIKRLVSDRRKSTRRKVVKVVAVVMLTVTAGVSSVLWMNDDGVYGGRRVMDTKICRKIRRSRSLCPAPPTPGFVFTAKLFSRTTWLPKKCASPTPS